jgi:hypothetical protein
MTWLTKVAQIGPAPGTLKNPQDPEDPVNIVPCPLCGEGTIGLPPGEPCACCRMEGKTQSRPAPLVSQPAPVKGTLPTPGHACQACGERSWWWRAPNKMWGSPGEWVCGRCHPNPVLEMAGVR